MWPFTSKKSLLDAGILQGFADHHSHILPGVDDGFRSLDDSLEALRTYERHGVARLWLTPHIMDDYPNTTADLRRRFDELKAAYATIAGPKPIELHLAAEYMLDTLFARRLADGDLLGIGDEENSLLVETSFFNPPADLDGLLADIASAGYRPLLAHPERYIYMDMNDYERLHQAGVHFQLNVVALGGAYGPDVAKRARRLLELGFYHKAGSDMHRLAATMGRLAAPLKSDLADKTIELRGCL